MSRKLQYQKARVRCSNGVRIPDPLKMRRNAAIRIMPDDVQKKSECRMQLPNGLNVFAHISPEASDSRRCQDAAVLINEGEYGLFGVIDGFGELGHHLPKELAWAFSGFLYEIKNKIHSPEDAAELLLGCSRSSLYLTSDSLELDIPGGAAALMAFALPERVFILSLVEDCAGYLLKADGSVMRLFDYNNVAGNGGRQSLSDQSMSFTQYASLRRYVSSPIDMDLIRDKKSDRRPTCLTKERVDEAVVQLGEGESLLLTTDGITKNLFIDVDDDGIVTDVGGSSDVAEIIDGKIGAFAIGRAILSAFRKRARTGSNEHVWHPDGRRIRLPVDDDCGLIVISSEE